MDNISVFLFMDEIAYSFKKEKKRIKKSYICELEKDNYMQQWKDDVQNIAIVIFYLCQDTILVSGFYLKCGWKKDIPIHFMREDTQYVGEPV